MVATMGSSLLKLPRTVEILEGEVLLKSADFRL